MKKLIIFAILLVVSTTGFAQIDATYRAKFAEADRYFQRGNFHLALPVFLQIYEKAPDNANLNFCIGMCYLNGSTDREASIPYLEKAVKNVSVTHTGIVTDATSSVFSWFYLGKAYHVATEFDKAIGAFEEFKKYINKHTYPEDWEKTLRYIEISYNGQRLKRNPLHIKVTNLGSNINTKYPEYTPVIASDESFLLFTSRREGGVSDALDKTGQYYEDIFISKKQDDGTWGKAELFDPNINTDGHEAIVSISHDGKQIFIYRGDENIYTSSKTETGWTAPEKLGPNINTRNWETHASLSPDGKTLYFTSNRPGGFGGRDIYKSEKRADGTWGTAINLGPTINTEYDEESPHIHHDGKTLYFSSKGHETMGGFDIFVSVLSDDGHWSKPENIGFPLNSSDDDVFYMPTSDPKIAYYSSVRAEGYGDKDIYRIEILREKQLQIVFKGNVRDNDSYKAIEAELEIIDKSNNETIAKLQTDSATGEFSLSIPMGKTYTVKVSAEDYLDFSENFDIHAKEDVLYKDRDFYLKKAKPVAVEEIKKEVPVEKEIVLRNVYFDFKRSILRRDAKEELNRLVELMKKMPDMRVEISGHTDAAGSAKFNMQLSQWRVESVVAYLVRRGIKANRMETKYFGKTKPVATNETREGRAENRRVELKILSK